MKNIFAITFILLLLGCSQAEEPGSNEAAYVDIAEHFSHALAPWTSIDPTDVISGQAGLTFEPIVPPEEIAIWGQENWLKTQLTTDLRPQSSNIIEIPGHLFSRVDAWFVLSDGEVVHQRSGNKYPYEERQVKHAGIAFKIPYNHGEPVDVIVRMQLGVPVNFAALLWDDKQWDNYVFAQRTWYGMFLGAILVLLVYNLFFAVMLRDKSYLYYVGYILSLTTIVLIYSGLLVEYVWPDGTWRIHIMLVAGAAIFFAIGFVNSFLNIRERSVRLYQVSTIVSILALIFGILLTFKIRIVPVMLTGTTMHILLLLGSVYFFGISLYSYFKGVKQARFLALSMVALIAGLVGYFLYTYAVIRYNIYVIHAIEFGALLEGTILSLALADRINLLSVAKEKAEKHALDTQRSFSKRLLQAQEADRESFSNTMHDSLGHSMLVLKQNLEKIAQTKEKDDTRFDGGSNEALLEQVAYCSEVLSDVRGLSHDLHPHLLRRLGLKSALESTLERAFSNTDIEWQADIEKLIDHIDKEYEITIFRVCQECINNILKHAEASEVIVSLHLINGHIEVNIKDDGIGFDVSQASGDGLGLHGMRERIRLFGGVFAVVSHPGEGTHIRFSLPVA